MKTYELFTYAGEFDVTANLTLKDDGKFAFYESYTSWGGGYGTSASGTWRRDGDGFILSVESADERMSYSYWIAGEERQAIEQPDGGLDLGHGLTMWLVKEPAAEPEPKKTAAPEPVKAVQPEKPVEKKKPLPIVADFYFKDSTIRQRQLPPDPMFGLFDQTFYRLVDENGKVTNMFKLRKSEENADSIAVVYDEIDFTPSDESDED